jgi:hypothetical protein
MNKYIDPRFESLLKTQVNSTLVQKQSKTSYDLPSDGAKGYNSGWIDALKFILSELPLLEAKVDKIISSRPAK